MGDKQDYKLLRLDKDNYAVWKWQFKNILRAKKLEKVLIAGQDNAEMDAQALALLGSALNEENMLKIINCETFTDAWKSIEVCFENKTTYEPQNLFRRLNAFKINSASEVSQGISELKGIVAQLKNLNENVSDNNLIGAILSALPSSFDIFVTVWKNSADQDLDSLVAKVIAEATDQISKESVDTKALAARSNQKRGNNNGNRTNVDKDQCRYCKEKGHWIKDCKKLKGPYNPNHNKNKDNNDNNKNNKKENDRDGNEDFAFLTKVSQVKLPDDLWVADSGCTYHMTPYKWLFSSFSSSNKIGTIQLADESLSLKVEGQGEITTEQGKMKNVLYVPGLSQNLFSISSASINGLTHYGDKDKIKFYHKDKEIFVAHLKNKLYLIKLTPLNPLSAQVKSATLNEWHSRFNHVSQDAIKIMKKNNVVDGLDLVTKKDDKCQECSLNKCTRVHHPLKSTPKAVKAGSVLHIDTSGKSNVMSLGGSQYFVLCKDEASSYRLNAFVTTKDQIPNVVKEFISRAELETGNPVLKMVTDNGTEFVNNDLKGFLKSRGIIHENSAPYVAQQNGFIEREMRTHKEAAKTMLTNSKLDKNLWAEAVNCATYTLNRVVNQANQNATPYELWFGTKPNVKNLRCFGELAVIKKQDSQVKGSWDERGTKAIFVGYTDKFNTYRFLVNGKITITCDASFVNVMHNEEPIVEREESESLWINGNPIDYMIVNDDAPLGGDVNESDESAGIDQNELFQNNNISMSMDPFGSPVGAFGSPMHSTPNTTIEEPMPMQAPAAQGQPIPEPSRREQVALPEVPASPQRPAASQSTTRRINPYFNTDVDHGFTINQGSKEERFRLSDLEFRPNANNWINLRTGRFIAKDQVRLIKESVDRQNRRANVAKALNTKQEIEIPKSYEEATRSFHHQGWKGAMDDEMKSLKENQVYEVIPRDQVNKKIVSSRWVFVVKYKQNGEIDKFKARVVARGFSQVYGEDYEATYCSVVQVMTTRFMLSFAAKNRMRIRQFDVKTAFLNGDLKEEIFMEPPEGYGKQGEVWKLKRSLYGLKQSPRMWNEKFTSFMTSLGFTMSNYDNSVFYKLQPFVILIIYVDDGLIFAYDDLEISQMMKKLQNQFEIRELEVNVYRGLEIEMQEDGILIHQSGQVRKILATFNMTEAKPAKNPIVKLDKSNDEPLRPNVPYRSAIGMLQYLSDSTRPDISFAVNKLARKMANPTESDWTLVKHLLRYLCGNPNMGIKFRYGGNTKLVGYSDSDFAGDPKSARSTTGFVIMFNDAPIHWKSQLQRHVTVSSTEAEVVALCSLSKVLSWIRRMAIELHIINDEPAVIRCDNKSALMIAESERLAGRTRHLRAQYAYVYEQVEYDELVLQHVKSEYNLADLLTKMVQTGLFVNNRNAMLQQVDSHQGVMLSMRTVDANPLSAAAGFVTPISLVSQLPDVPNDYVECV